MGSNVLWKDLGSAPPLPPLAGDMHADVCVVGAGIVGLTTAYLLAREGRSVIVLDHGAVGGGESGRTTAHLSWAMDDGFTELVKMHGRETTRRVTESHLAAIDRIEQIIAEEDIACDFERLDGYLFDPPGARRRHVPAEYEEARRLGFAVELVDRVPFPHFDTGPAVRFERQGTFHPLKYLHGLVEAIRRSGGELFGDVHVTAVDDGQVRTRGGAVVQAHHIVLATNAPIHTKFGANLRQEPYRTCVVAARVPRGYVAPALYWDTLDPYHFVRLWSAPEAEWDALIIGGEDHHASRNRDLSRHFERLERWARARFPKMEAVEYRWSGLVLEPYDGLAFIGRAGEGRTYIATGDSGQGMTHGTIAGMLIGDLVAGRPNPWEQIYDPARVRVTPGTVSEMLRLGAEVAGHLAERVGRGEVRTPEQIAPGEGSTVRRDGQMVAVYRDESGDVHETSAVCTHLGCVVHWNSSEKRWECPCHGSRFDPLGKVLNGPATEDLVPVKVPELAK